MSIEAQPGVGPLFLEQDGGARSSGLVVPSTEIYQTPLLDISQPVFGIEVVPAKFGLVAVTFALPNNQWFVESIVGVQTSPPHCQAGSDAAHTNLYAPDTGDPINALVNAGTAPPFLAGVASATALAAYMPNTPVFFDLTVGATGTGGYKCMAKLIFIITWIAVGG